MIRTLAIQNCELETFGIYGDELSTREDVTLEVVHAYRGERLPDAGEIDMALVGGTPISAYETDAHEFLRQELDLLRELLARRVPLLGVCCGAQMLAMLLGASVRRADAMEIGGYRARLTSTGVTDPLLAGFPRELPVFHWHGDTFSVPPGGDLLITGTGCPNQMFRVGVVAGLQFHLETRADEAGRWIDAYADELAAAGRTASEVLDEARDSEAERERLARLLITNFLALAIAQGPRA